MVPATPSLATVTTPPRTVPGAKPGSAPATPADSQRRGTLRNVLELRLGALATSLDKGEIMMMRRYGGGADRGLKADGGVAGEEDVAAAQGRQARVTGIEEDCAARRKSGEVRVEEEVEETEDAAEGVREEEHFSAESDVAIEGLVLCPGGEVDLSALMC